MARYATYYIHRCSLCSRAWPGTWFDSDHAPRYCRNLTWEGPDNPADGNILIGDLPNQFSNSRFCSRKAVTEELPRAEKARTSYLC